MCRSGQGTRGDGLAVIGWNPSSATAGVREQHLYYIGDLAARHYLVR
jgi:hypothetical protein